MSAGTGVTHSELNASQNEQVHFLQIGVLPETIGLDPGYEQKNPSLNDRRNRLCLRASPDGHDGSVTVRQDIRIDASMLDNGHKVTHLLVPARKAYTQPASGTAEMNGHLLYAGDGAPITEEPFIVLAGMPEAEVLVFDIA